MANFHTIISTQGDENERNFAVNGTSTFSTDMVFRSYQDLMDWAQNVGRSLGYVIVTKSSFKQASGALSEVILICDHGGITNTNTKKTNCRFELVGKYSFIYDFWTLKVVCEEHNHEPSLHIENHPYASRLLDNETSLVVDLLKKKVKPQENLSKLKEKYTNNEENAFDAHKLKKIKIEEYAFDANNLKSTNFEANATSGPTYTFNAHKRKYAFICDDVNGHDANVDQPTFPVNATSAFSTDKVFRSRENLTDWVQKLGRSLGYVIITKRSNKKGSGPVSEVNLMCDRGGIYTSQSSIRNTKESKKINCPFKLVGKYSKINGFWTLRVAREEHNHEPALDLNSHPYVRRLSDNETRLVSDLTKKKVKPQEILSTLKEKNTNNTCTLKTIYNARQKFQKTGYAAETYIEQSINSEENAPYEFDLNNSKKTTDHTDQFGAMFDNGEPTFEVNGTPTFSTDRVFKSRKDLMDWAQKVARSLGYVITIKRSYKSSGDTCQVMLMCDRGGVYKNKSSIRNSKGTRKTNCPFELVGKYSKKHKFWTLKVICEEHNHEPAPNMEGHPYASRLSDNETRLVVALLIKNVKAHEILTILKERDPNNLSTLKTIYNAQQKLRKGGFSDVTEALIEQPINNEESASTSDANMTNNHCGSVPDQMLMPCVVKDVSDANTVWNALMCHDTNAPHHDDDGPTFGRPRLPKEEFFMQDFLVNYPSILGSSNEDLV